MQSRSHRLIAITAQAALVTVALTFGLHAQQPTVDAPKRGSPVNTQSDLRDSPETLQRELMELNAKINTQKGRILAGKQAMETWQEAYTKIQELLASQIQHEAACQLSKNKLRFVEQTGTTPERFLEPSRQHVRECDEAAGRLRSYVESLAAEITQSKSEIDHIETAVGLAGNDEITMQRRRRLLEQILQFSTDSVKKAIDKYNNSKLGF
jgi:hypothetical protein